MRSAAAPSCAPERGTLSTFSTLDPQTGEFTDPKKDSLHDLRAAVALTAQQHTRGIPGLAEQFESRQWRPSLLAGTISRGSPTRVENVESVPSGGAC
jgi:hypothetical protein